MYSIKRQSASVNEKAVSVMGPTGMGKSCEISNEALSAFIDGELTQEETLEVTSHLEGCADCAEVVQKYRLLQSSFRTATRPFASGPSRSIWDSIAEQTQRPSTED